MKKTRLLSLLTAVAAAGFMTACDFGSDSDDSSKPEISGFSADLEETSTPWGVNTRVTFTGTVKDDNAVKEISLQIVNPTTNQVVATVLTQPVNDGSVSLEDLDFTLVNSGEWVTTGAYLVRLVAVDNDGLTNFADLNFSSIVGTGAVGAPDTATVILGASGAAPGSYLDIWDMTVYKASEVTAEVRPDIDVYFDYSSSAGSVALYNTYVAKNGLSGSQGFTEFATWGTDDVSQAKVAVTTLTEAQFNALTTVAAVNQAVDAAQTGTGRAIVTAGSVIAVVNGSEKALLLVRTVSGTGNASTVTIKGAF